MPSWRPRQAGPWSIRRPTASARCVSKPISKPVAKPLKVTIPPVAGPEVIPVKVSTQSPREHKAPFIGAKEIMPGFVSAMDALRALRLKKLAGRYPEVAKLLKSQKPKSSGPVAEGAD